MGSEVGLGEELCSTRQSQGLGLQGEARNSVDIESERHAQGEGRKPGQSPPSALMCKHKALEPMLSPSILLPDDQPTSY